MRERERELGYMRRRVRTTSPHFRKPVVLHWSYENFVFLFSSQNYTKRISFRRVQQRKHVPHSVESETIPVP